MTPPTLVLLPGLDGSGRLLAALQAAMGALVPGLVCQVVSFPPKEPLNYDELVQRLAGSRLPDGPLVLVAESFSGPLALKLAQHPSVMVTGLVLAATFATPPVPAASLVSRPVRSTPERPGHRRVLAIPWIGCRPRRPRRARRRVSGLVIGLSAPLRPDAQLTI